MLITQGALGDPGLCCPTPLGFRCAYRPRVRCATLGCVVQPRWGLGAPIDPGCTARPWAVLSNPVGVSACREPDCEAVKQQSPGSRSAPRGRMPPRGINPERVAHRHLLHPVGVRGYMRGPSTQGALRDPGLCCPTPLGFRYVHLPRVRYATLGCVVRPRWGLGLQ
jgi:hypothetical protein